MLTIALGIILVLILIWVGLVAFAAIVCGGALILRWLYAWDAAIKERQRRQRSQW